MKLQVRTYWNKRNLMKNSLPTTIIIFGASGDLTQRKLIPSLFNLYRKDRLPEKFIILGFAGSRYTDESFRKHLREGMEKFAGYEFDEAKWQAFEEHLHYHSGDYTEPGSFRAYDEQLRKLEGGPANRMFYLAIPPYLFPIVIEKLGETGQTEEDTAWRRIVIEKPFGTDLASAKALNEEIHKTLEESQIYRIDHYLGKETVQNILMFRFANTIFEPLWNRNYVDHIQITVAEEVGVGHRAGYYDDVGVLRDMFQNHLMQLLTLTAMEPPSSFNATALRNEKVKVLNSIVPLTGDVAAFNTVRGQYKGYCEEPGVDEHSTTATYAAVRFFIDNWRWQGVPFYLRSGKNLAEKLTQIIIQFKCPPLQMFPLPPGTEMKPNALVLFLQPDEGMHLRFEAKEPDTVAEMRSVDMEFHYADEFGPMSIPDAYERLLLDVLQGDASLFTRADEVEAAWNLIDAILAEWKTDQAPPLNIYEPGTWGPVEANALLAKDGRAWMHEEAKEMLED
jgi:glucose-6-phosphate 1-dehydrogenase